MDPIADYGAPDGVPATASTPASSPDHWDDLLRVAGSLATGAVTASDLLRTLQRGPGVTTLTRALAELGRIAKTLYLLD
jgi:TnpA family transposase